MTARGAQAQPGDIVGDAYRLERLIGTGGMGAVWSASIAGSYDRVAVKFLHGQMAVDPLMVQRFLLEARAGTEIRHRNVVRVLASGWIQPAREGDAAVPWLAMELLEGRTLGDVLRPRARLEPIDAIALGAEIAAGTAAAHRAGIVHRDIKPANVFLHEEPDDVVVPKVLDFGISKFVDPGLDGGLTTTGALIGSAMYMSPEQAMGGHNVDERTDVWALGVLLYRMLTGEAPIPGVQAEVLTSLATAQPLSLGALRNPLVPQRVAALVRRCLKKKREERYDSAVEVEAELRAVLAESKERPRLAHLLRPTASAATVISAPAEECREGETTAARTAPTGLVSAADDPAPRAVPEPPPTVRIPDAEREAPPRTSATFVALASGILAFALAIGIWRLVVSREPPPPADVAAVTPSAESEAETENAPPEASGAPAEPPPAPGATGRAHVRPVVKPRPTHATHSAAVRPPAPPPSPPPPASAPDPWRKPGF